MVITLGKALRNAWRTTTRSGRPDSSAYRLKSAFSMRCIVACVILRIGPALINERVSTGQREIRDG